jgi:hypothetical protein
VSLATDEGLTLDGGLVVLSALAWLAMRWMLSLRHR